MIDNQKFEKQLRMSDTVLKQHFGTAVLRGVDRFENEDHECIWMRLIGVHHSEDVAEMMGWEQPCMVGMLVKRGQRGNCSLVNIVYNCYISREQCVTKVFARW